MCLAGWSLTFRLSICCSLLLFLLAAPTANHAACSPAGSGIVGWWPAEGSGADIAGTNNGSLQGGASASATGLVGTAFSFDGTNGYVQIPNSAVLRPTNFTIE